MDSSAKSADEVVEEIMRIHRSLPPRPVIDDVEAAVILIRNADNEEQSRIESIARQKKRKHISEELFNVLVEMQKHLVHFQSKEQKREAVKLLDLENYHQLFDEMIQRASKCCAPSNNNSTQSVASSSSSSSPLTNPPSSSVSVSTTSTSSLSFDKEPVKSPQFFTRDDSYVEKSKSSFHGGAIGGGLRSSEFFRPQIVDSTLKPAITSGPDGEKLSLIKLASLIEVSSKKGLKDLNLHNKLMDQIEWLPDSIGKLSSLVTLNLSENQLLALPSSIGSLLSLTKLNLYSNKIVELPESIGNLVNLVHLDLRGNLLTSLPATFGRLTRLQDLDLSSNNLPVLPDSLGSLVSLQKLNIETNGIEEIPHAIGHCTSLTVLLADYNKLKALPEAVGRIESLEKLSVRYNNISRLPTTMSSLKNIKQLDLSFNELDSVPESLCFATTLIKINISNNFADLRSLPRSIGNLENLEELDMSNNQIRILPDSFRMLSKLRVLKVEGNPLEVPAHNVVEQGAQAVVRYISEAHEKKDLKSPLVKHKKSWTRFFFFSRSNKRKRRGLDYVAA
ncbi:plant intracellular Ras-group-related LRR protein 4-like [Cynara cardunculus var. scolymus]|uniref:Leucine-rich repeat-containing protein n=1 Tax=Cynara cardunculus var. scolymus TaxID=59895 RepID=A0A103Y5N3_CYNCS|nr:plant intracellular Ras-group-related LRR protein 4-like [Cynara cardunculus var. scolymus]KVI02996.1 Leucine-rich repeat-containing protein [Cynara cardunculus var. scolymus]